MKSIMTNSSTSSLIENIRNAAAATTMNLLDFTVNVVGDRGVGKTELVRRFMADRSDQVEAIEKKKQRFVNNLICFD